MSLQNCILTCSRIFFFCVFAAGPREYLHCFFFLSAILGQNYWPKHKRNGSVRGKGTGRTRVFLNGKLTLISQECNVYHARTGCVNEMSSEDGQNKSELLQIGLCI